MLWKRPAVCWQSWKKGTERKLQIINWNQESDPDSADSLRSFKRLGEEYLANGRKKQVI